MNDGHPEAGPGQPVTADTVRVVLDLASIKSYAAFPLHDPERLVIDVTGETSGTQSPLPEVQRPAACKTPAI